MVKYSRYSSCSRKVELKSKASRPREPIIIYKSVHVKDSSRDSIYRLTVVEESLAPKKGPKRPKCIWKVLSDICSKLSELVETIKHSGWLKTIWKYNEVKECAILIMNLLSVQDRQHTEINYWRLALLFLNHAHPIPRLGPICFYFGIYRRSWTIDYATLLYTMN